MSDTGHWTIEDHNETKRRNEIADLQLATLRLDVSTWEERWALAKEHTELLRDVNLSAKRSADASERIAEALESMVDPLRMIATKVCE